MERALVAFRAQFDLLEMQHTKGIPSVNIYTVQLMNMLSIIRVNSATPHRDFTTRVRGGLELYARVCVGILICFFVAEGRIGIACASVIVWWMCCGVVFRWFYFVSAAGSDDSTGPDTECVPRLCTGRYFVENHDCSECPAGQFNPSANFSDEDRGLCVEFDACAAFVSTFNETSSVEVQSNDTLNRTVVWAVRQSFPCRENGDPQAVCVDHRAPDRNRTCVCSAGWQNFSWDTLSSRVPHAYGPDAISSAAFASATSLGDAWGQFASEPYFTSGVGYTTCLPLLCEYDEHVVNQSCVACSPGTTREPGDDASVPASLGGNTECSVVVCGANEFVVNHSYAVAVGLDNVDFCQPCPPGSTRPAGDNATYAPGTECAPTICGRNQQVVNHACEACAPGTKNADGGYVCAMA